MYIMEINQAKIIKNNSQRKTTTETKILYK